MILEISEKDASVTSNLRLKGWPGQIHQNKLVPAQGIGISLRNGQRTFLWKKTIPLEVEFVTC